MAKKANTLLREDQSCPKSITTGDNPNIWCYVSEEGEGMRNLIWVGRSICVVDDPIMIDEIGGKYIFNRLRTSQEYGLEIKKGFEKEYIQITKELETWRLEMIKEILHSGKERLKETNIKELEERTIYEGVQPRFDYLKRIFPDASLFAREGRGPFGEEDIFGLYFFEEKKLKAILERGI